MIAIKLLIVAAVALRANTFSKFEQESLVAHNTYRAKHGVPPLTLNKTISAWAQDWANHLAANDIFIHHPNNIYGENLYGTTGKDFTGETAVSAWYSEIHKYDYDNPSFAGTGHFTQVVWKNSKQLGIGIASSATTRWTYVVANYDPPGNYVGQLEENVLKPIA